MMYSEFVAGTGCKDNAHNYEVFKNLEVMYMNTEMSKADIYEYGKKLVDNSKSEEQLKFEAEIKAEIEICKREIEQCQNAIDWNKQLLDGETDKYWIDSYKTSIKYYRNEMKTWKNKVASLKWVLQ